MAVLARGSATRPGPEKREFGHLAQKRKKGGVPTWLFLIGFRFGSSMF